MKGTRLRWNTVVFLISWDEQRSNHASTDLRTDTGPVIGLRYEFLNHCIGNILELCSSEAKQSPSWIYLAKVKSVIFQLSLKMMFSRYKLVWLFDYNQDRYFFYFWSQLHMQEWSPKILKWLFRPNFDAQFHNGFLLFFYLVFMLFNLVNINSRWC